MSVQAWLEIMQLGLRGVGRTLDTRLTSTKRFTNLKVNLKCLRLYIGAKMQLVSYEFEYFFQCNMTFWGPRGLQGTHIDASSPFSSRLMTLNQRGSL